MTKGRFGVTLVMFGLTMWGMHHVFHLGILREAPAAIFQWTAIISIYGAAVTVTATIFWLGSAFVRLVAAD